MTNSTKPQVSQRTWWIVGIVGVTVMTGIAIWFGIAGSVGKVHWVNTGHEIVSDEQVDIRFDLRRDPTRTVVCELQAQDFHHARVGTGKVTVGPSPKSPSRHIESLRTVAPAVTGYVERCEYAD